MLGGGNVDDEDDVDDEVEVVLLDVVSGEVEDVVAEDEDEVDVGDEVKVVLLDVVSGEMVMEVSELIDDSETVLLLDGSVLMLDSEDIVEDDEGLLRLEVLPGEAAGTLSVVG